MVLQGKDASHMAVAGQGSRQRHSDIVMLSSDKTLCEKEIKKLPKKHTPSRFFSASSSSCISPASGTSGLASVSMGSNACSSGTDQQFDQKPWYGTSCTFGPPCNTKRITPQGSGGSADMKGRALCAWREKKS